MSPASSRHHRPLLGQAGTASLKFALVAIPFFLLLIAGMDLGRYFITQHSLRTLTSEAARSALVYCYGATAACSLPVANKQTVEAKAPFLVAGSITLTASQTAPNPSTGVRTISVSAQYAPP